MSDLEEDIVAFMADAAPETTPGEIDWLDNTTLAIEDPHSVLVKLDPVVAGMSYDEFCKAINQSGETSMFSVLIEVYEPPEEATGNRNAVFRVTGQRVDNAPRYFLDAPTALLVLHGAYARDNFAVALYDEDAFEKSAHQYIDPYRLFDPDTRENRAEDIRYANAVMDELRATNLEEDVEELREETSGGIDDYFEEYHSDSSRTDDGR